MISHSLEETLKTLTYYQASILYWTCEGWSNENVAAKHNYTKAWVVWQMSFVYHKLGIDRIDQKTGKKPHWVERRALLQEKVCPILRRLINDDPEKLEIFPITPPNVYEGDLIYIPPGTPESEIPPLEPNIPRLEAQSEPPPLPAPGENPPPEPPPDFYPIELYNAWLAVLEDDRNETPPPPIAPPIRDRREERPILWGRLIGLGLAVLLGCAFVGWLAYWWGTRQNPPPAPPTMLSTNTQEILATETLSQPSTATISPLPSETLTATLTATPSMTLTTRLTDTISPIGLTKGQELSDNRVTLKYKEFKFEQGRTRVGQRPPAPILFEFDFTNHSGETILLQLGQDKFRAEDNLGNQLTCEFWDGVTNAVENIQRPLENEKTWNLGVFCGEGKIPSGVTTYTLYVTGFSSLPDSTWIANVPR